MGTGSNDDNPLDRLAAEEDWSKRVRDAERDVARDRRKARVWRPVSQPRSARSGFAGRSSVGRPARTGGISPIFIALVVITAVSGVTLWLDLGPASASVFVFVLGGWLITLCLHEFSHALTAHRSGDDTVAGKGYLRLDPRKYGHPILTFVIPLVFLLLGGIPLPGGAVMIESHRLRNRFRDALVSAAGPAINIIAAVILLAAVSIGGPEAIYDVTEPHAPFWSALTFLAYLQVATAILNLLPVPGLDGYGIIEPYLPASARRIGNQIRPYGLIVVFVLLYLPVARDAFSSVSYWILDTGGAPINGDYYGYELFRFWSGWFK
ncbi:Zn-dependent protease [Allocatelliglobosispora scoriae]|uniref:Zn-dependent protease n=1 Tax=Allocatelliglobosispora scoriae TaxID=643052 RepID=A0A841BPX3_9ACTN|nr:site-2 protease family protein [Allocatelliglobosispora scoriae]MBB5868870.1 Zn-dependent protease [Allocatelliglobosispora scoriae]